MIWNRETPRLRPSPSGPLIGQEGATSPEAEGYRIWLPSRLDRGPPRLRSGQAPARVERPSINDKPLIVERRSLRSALRAPVETTEIAICDSPIPKRGEESLEVRNYAARFFRMSQ